MLILSVVVVICEVYINKVVSKLIVMVIMKAMELFLVLVVL